MDNKIAKSGIVLLIVTLVSKVAAFLVTIVFSFYFGSDSATDAYYAAGTVPNLINNSLTICALTLFIPIYEKCKRESGGSKTDGFVSNVLNLFVVFNFSLSMLVCIAAPGLAKLVAPGFSAEGLVHTTRMIRFLSLSFPFTVAVYVLNNLLNANHWYILPAVLTVVNHVIVIILNILLAPKFGIYSYPFICIVAWLVQLIIIYWQSRNKLFRHRMTIDFQDRYLRTMLFQSIPVMVATAADQINLAADNIIASDLPSGSLSCLGYAHRTFSSVNGVVSSSLLTIYYPIISRQYAEHDTSGLNMSLHRYLEVMLLMSLPISLILIGNSDNLMSFLFGRGAMSNEAITTISALFIAYMTGLLFISAKDFITRLFYVIGETGLPTMINLVCVVTNIILSIILKKWWGVVGIAVATTISTAVFCGVEAIALLHRSGGVMSLVHRKIIQMKGVLQILFACSLAMISMLQVQKMWTTGSSLSDMVLYSTTFVLVAISVLVLGKNEYSMWCFSKIRKRKRAKGESDDN